MSSIFRVCLAATRIYSENWRVRFHAVCTLLDIAAAYPSVMGADAAPVVRLLADFPLSTFSSEGEYTGPHGGAARSKVSPRRTGHAEVVEGVVASPAGSRWLQSKCEVDAQCVNRRDAGTHRRAHPCPRPPQLVTAGCAQRP